MKKLTFYFRNAGARQYSDRKLHKPDTMPQERTLTICYKLETFTAKLQFANILQCFQV